MIDLGHHPHTIEALTRGDTSIGQRHNSTRAHDRTAEPGQDRHPSVVWWGAWHAQIVFVLQNILGAQGAIPIEGHSAREAIHGGKNHAQWGWFGSAQGDIPIVTPGLGVRGERESLAHIEVCRTQVRDLDIAGPSAATVLRNRLIAQAPVGEHVACLHRQVCQRIVGRA